MRETSVPKTFILSPSKQGSKNFQVKINFLHFYILLYYHIYGTYFQKYFFLNFDQMITIWANSPPLHNDSLS